MNRELIIKKLRSDLEYLNRQLIRTYSVPNLVSFLNTEKEIQIQLAYLKMENK